MTGINEILESIKTDDDAACLLHMKSRPEYVRRRFLEINRKVDEAQGIVNGMLAALEYWFSSEATAKELADRARAAIDMAKGTAN